LSDFGHITSFIWGVADLIRELEQDIQGMLVEVYQ